MNSIKKEPLSSKANIKRPHCKNIAFDLVARVQNQRVLIGHLLNKNYSHCNFEVSSFVSLI